MEFDVQSPWTYRDMLGESPVWDPGINSLLRVDCDKGDLIWLDVVSGRQIVQNMGAEVGFAGFASTGKALVSVGQGLVAVTRTGERRPVFSAIDPMYNDSCRFNDGEIDLRGRLFTGTLESTFSGKAGFYRFDEFHEARQLIGSVSVANGLDWDRQRRRMYWTDSIEYRVDVFDYDEDSGEVSGRRTFVEFDKTDGMPDGMAIDADGFLWVSMFQGWAIRRYAPDGSLNAVVDIPTKCPTSIIIGGPDGKTAYVTSSSSWISDQEKLDQPLAGAVFTFNAGIDGVEPGRMAI